MKEKIPLTTFYINGKGTKWRIGWGLGEPVYYYHSGDNTRFIPDQRVCWELMQSIIDDVHRLPTKQQELYTNR